MVRLHWSIPDPVPVGTRAAFEDAYADIQRRIQQLLTGHDQRRETKAR